MIGLLSLLIMDYDNTAANMAVANLKNLRKIYKHIYINLLITYCCIVLSLQSN